MGYGFLSHKPAFYAMFATWYDQLGNNTSLTAEFNGEQLIKSAKGH